MLAGTGTGVGICCAGGLIVLHNGALGVSCDGGCCRGVIDLGAGLRQFGDTARTLAKGTGEFTT